VSDARRVANVAEAYYDSREADEFYFHIWGGEDIHIGLYDSPADPIPSASRRTVEAMADEIAMVPDDRHRIIDVGSGYGGPARYLAERFGSRVVCLNISEVENARNRKANREQGLENLVSVRHGSFEDIPEPDEKLRRGLVAGCDPAQRQPRQGHRRSGAHPEAGRRVRVHRSDAGGRLPRWCAAAGV
jgi:sarcosine/dimethylglycine N-methyltransferase